MKRLRYIFVVWFCVAYHVPQLHAQTPDDNQNKYWGFRDRLKKYYLKIGSNPGESIPSARRDSEDIFTDPQNNPFQGMIKWTDATTYLGHYIAILATEYRLLKNDGQNEQANKTLFELYYAIQAVNRLDKTSDQYHSQNPQTPLNQDGWPLRDDVPANFKDNWQNTTTNWLQSDAFDAEGSRNSPGNETFGEANEPSQDQLINLMMGFAMVKKCVESYIEVQPTPQDTKINLVDEVRDITIRMMDKVVELKSTRGLSPGNERLGLFDEQNWSFGNPVTGHGLQNGSDVFMFGTAFPIAKAAEWITDEDYERGFRFKFFIVNNNNPVELVLPFSSLESMWNKRLLDGVTHICFDIDVNIVTPGESIIATVVSSTLTTAGVSIIDNFTQNFAGFNIPTPFQITVCIDISNKGVNSLLATMASAISNAAPRDFVVPPANHPMAFSIKKSAFDIHKSEVILLIHDVLFDKTPNQDEKDTYEALINSAPLCDGTYNFREPGSRGPSNWAKADRWLHPEIADGTNGEYGNFSGLDYMLLYNLYHLKFDNWNSTPLPEYKDDYCPCENSVFADHAIEVPINSTQPTINFPMIISSYNYNYSSLGIPQYKYLVNSATVTGNTGTVSIESDYKVCSGNTLNVDNYGKVTVGNHTQGKKSRTWIAPGSSLVLTNDGILEIQDNSTVVIDESASLILDGVTHIVLNGQNAVLEIKGDLILRNGAVFKISGGSNGKGYVVFDINATHWSNTPNIQVVGSNCKVDLEGEGSTDKILVIKNRYISAPGKLSSATDYLEYFKIQNGAVELGRNSFLNIGNPSYFYNTTFTRLSELNTPSWNINADGHNGLVLWGEEAQILNCTFEHGKFGIRNGQFLYGSSLKVQNSAFENCITGVETHSKGGHFYNTTFNNCITGWKALSMEFDALVDRCSFSNANDGINYHGSQYQQLVVYKSNFTQNSISAITNRISNVAVECSGISDNAHGIKSVAASVNISGDLPVFNNPYNRLTKVYPGKNNFTDNMFAVRFYNGYDYFLNNGYNLFSTTLQNTVPYPPYAPTLGYGIGQVRVTWGPMISGDYIIPANNNSWNYDNPALVLEDEHPNLYSFTTFLVNPQTTLSYKGALKGVKLSGPINGICSPVPTGPSAYDPAPTGTQVLQGTVNSNTFFYSPHVRTIPTGPFVGTPYGEALFQILASPYDPATGKIKYQTIKDLYHYLVATNTFISAEELKLTDYAFENYQVFLAMAINHDIFFGNALQKVEAIDDFNEIVSIRTSRLPSIFADDLDLIHAHSTELLIDKGLMERTFGDLVASISTLQSAQTNAYYDQGLIINEHVCHIEKELAVVTGVISKEDYLDLITTCPTYLGETGSMKMGSTSTSNSLAKHKTSSSVRLYPNPATDEFTIELHANAEGAMSFEIVDINGRVVRYENIVPLKTGLNKFEVTTSGIASGMYFVKISTPQKQFVEKMFLNNAPQH